MIRKFVVNHKPIIIFCAIYMDKNFVDVDGTIMIKPKSAYTSNGIDIIEIKVRRK